MIAMQYAFALPESYDVGLIRRRVADRAPAFERVPGLLLKTFLCTDRTARSPVPAVNNQYATFYLWRSAESALDFLVGDLFQAVVEAFGRPQVRLMPVLALDRSDTSQFPAVALHQTVAAGREMRPADVVREESQHRSAILARPGLFAQITALDSERWEVVRFTLWHNLDAAGSNFSNGQPYEVLHLSTPAPFPD